MEFTPIHFFRRFDANRFLYIYDHSHIYPNHNFFPDRAPVLPWGRADGNIHQDLLDIRKVDRQVFLRLLKGRSFQPQCVSNALDVVNCFTILPVTFPAAGVICRVVVIKPRLAVIIRG